MDHCRRPEFAGRSRLLPALAIALVPALLPVSGCAQSHLFQPRPTSGPSMEQSKMSKEDLHAALDDFKDIFESSVKQAAAKIDAATSDSATRKDTLLWQVRMISACFTICKQEDDIKVFLDLWTMCIRMRQYFRTGDGSDLFGDQQGVALTAAQKIQDEIERIGKSFMTEEQFAKAKKDAEAFAAANPIRTGFTNAVIRTTTTTPTGEPNALNTILSIPLTPFRAIEGVDRGADAIRGFTKVADRFTDDFEALPENVRWQLMLFLIDLQDNKMISSALASFEQFSRSSAQLAETADKLPAEVRRQASGLIEEVDSKQGNIQTTLTQAEKTATAIERTGQSVADAGRAWEGTARSIAQAIDGIRYGREPAPSTAPAAPPAPAPPVKVSPPAAPDDQSGDDSSAAAYLDDYRRTAETLTATATELRLFTEEARKLIESPQLAEQIRDVDTRMVGAVNLTAQQAQGLTDHIAWRSMQLILLIFVLALVYRALSRRLFKKAA
jgi:hypothetical protein